MGRQLTMGTHSFLVINNSNSGNYLVFISNVQLLLFKVGPPRKKATISVVCVCSKK